MQYALFFWLMALFAIGYYLCGKDLFSPTEVQVLGFLFAGFMCIYLLSYVNYVMHISTVLLMGSCLTLSVVVGAIIHHKFRKIRIVCDEHKIEKVVPLSNFFYFLSLICVLTSIGWQFSEMQRLSSGDTFFEIMTSYRNAVAGDPKTKVWPLGLRQLIHVDSALFLILGFNLIRFYEVLPKSKKIISVLLILGLIIQSLMAAQRSTMIHNLISYAMMYHLLRIQKNKIFIPYGFKKLFSIFIASLAAISLFILAAKYVGRGTKSFAQPLHSLVMYTGANIVNFDLYFHSPWNQPKYFGKNTFPGVFTALNYLGLGDYPPNYSMEYRRLNGYSLGNTYTCFRPYYADFGVAGVFALHLLGMTIFTIIYEYVKKKRNDVGILFLSSIYPAAVLSFYHTNIFIETLSLGFLENMFITFLLYSLFMRKSIRFKL